MKRQFIAGLIIICLSSCSTTVYQSLWQSKSIEADGNLNEWSLPLRFCDQDSKLCYTITNDSVNLYLCVRAIDEQVQMKILQAGMQLWIDTTGKNKQQVGIMFPFVSPGRNALPLPKINQDKKFDANVMMKEFIGKYNEMKLIGFKPPIGGFIPLKNNYNISAGINTDGISVMSYEAVIPFKTFYKQALSASDSTKIFGITIIVNALQMPQMSGSVPGGDMQKGGNLGGGGMPGGGGPPNGMPGGGGPPMQGGSGSLLTQVNSIKIKIKLKI